VAAVLAAEGILITTADAFAVGSHRPHALRLALGTPPRHELEPALHRLRTAIEAIPP
jgi:DNA-binding transcriptional MocR family regulator